MKSFEPLKLISQTMMDDIMTTSIGNRMLHMALKFTQIFLIFELDLKKPVFMNPFTPPIMKAYLKLQHFFSEFKHVFGSRVKILFSQSSEQSAWMIR